MRAVFARVCNDDGDSTSAGIGVESMSGRLFDNSMYVQMGGASGESV